HADKLSWSCTFRFMNLVGWDHKTLRRNSIFVMALLSLVMLMHEVFGRNGYLTLRHEKKEYTALQQQVQAVSVENQQLEQKIHTLKNNPAAVEKQARDQLHLAKPGEIIYMLPGRNSTQTQAASQHMPPSQTRPKR
ncbi:MAG TPA: septum formation initiator family protein, partial [Terriglobia bacterium]|nr:septum formation initiator family protein [Terriglobia bacterium]